MTRDGEFARFTSVRARCEHGVEHIIGTRYSVDNVVGPCWVASLTVFSKELVGLQTDLIWFYAATKNEVLAAGLTRLREGGCACPEGAFARRARSEQSPAVATDEPETDEA